MTTKSPDDKGDAPTPKDPPGATVARVEAADSVDPAPAGTAGVVESEPLPGRPPGDEPHVVPGAKSPGPEVVPPAQTNAAEAELSRAETRPAGRAAPEADAKDEPGGGGMPGDVHPAVVEYEKREAAQGQDAAKAEETKK